MSVSSKAEVALGSLALSLCLVSPAGLMNTKAASTHTNSSKTTKASKKKPKHYKVKKDDTLWSIAKDKKLKLHKLEALNGLNDESLILPGDKLKLKGKEIGIPKERADYTQQVAGQIPSPSVKQVATGNSSKEWIASHESSGSYSAQNGKYIGRYQLDSSYLNGDYSPANQERVADKYVADRYGSWGAAQAFWQANGWY